MFAVRCLKCCLVAEMENRGLLHHVPTDDFTPRRGTVHLPTLTSAGILLNLLVPFQEHSLLGREMAIV